MLGDEAPLTIETDVLDCACIDTIPYFTDPKTTPRDSIKAIPRYAVLFIKINRFKYALTITTDAIIKKSIAVVIIITLLSQDAYYTISELYFMVFLISI